MYPEFWTHINKSNPLALFLYFASKHNSSHLPSAYASFSIPRARLFAASRCELDELPKVLLTHNLSSFVSDMHLCGDGQRTRHNESLALLQKERCDELCSENKIQWIIPLTFCISFTRHSCLWETWAYKKLCQSSPIQDLGPKHSIMGLFRGDSG